jgi:hypothetical protein
LVWGAMMNYDGLEMLWVLLFKMRSRTKSRRTLKI